MHCVICHFVYRTYNFDSNTKRRKGLISYNQEHGTIFMKKHILVKHPITWHKWKSANVAFDIKELHQKSPIRDLLLAMGPS
jgi:hypothetical protein